GAALAGRVVGDGHQLAVGHAGEGLHLRERVAGGGEEGVAAVGVPQTDDVARHVVVEERGSWLQLWHWMLLVKKAARGRPLSMSAWSAQTRSAPSFLSASTSTMDCGLVFPRWLRACGSGLAGAGAALVVSPTGANHVAFVPSGTSNTSPARRRPPKKPTESARTCIGGSLYSWNGAS